MFSKFSVAGLLPLASATMPQLHAEFSLPHAAVATTAAKFGPTAEPALVVTTFAPSGTDAVWVARSLADVLNKNATIRLEQIENATQWPNQADVSEDGRQVLTACGFFVSPTKSTGSVDLFDVSQFPMVTRTKVSEDRKGNFYHKAVMVDVDGDGTDEVVAARAYKSMLNPFAKAEGELVWFQKATNGTWETRYLTTPQGDGPGVSFIPTDLDGDGKIEFVATQFFAEQQLSIWECTLGDWSACEGGAGVQTYVVDKEGKDGDAPFFNVQWVDLNMDGTKDLLATTNTADGTGAVYAYELAGDFRRGNSSWIKHTLATGYKPLHSILPGQGSPGSAVAFSPAKGKEPIILVSADDGGWVDVLNPTGSFTYSQDRLVTSTGTVGTVSSPISVDDSDRLVFFVPLFAEGKVQMYVVEP